MLNLILCEVLTRRLLLSDLLRLVSNLISILNWCDFPIFIYLILSIKAIIIYLFFFHLIFELIMTKLFWHKTGWLIFFIIFPDLSRFQYGYLIICFFIIWVSIGFFFLGSNFKILFYNFLVIFLTLYFHISMVVELFYCRSSFSRFKSVSRHLRICLVKSHSFYHKNRRRCYNLPITHNQITSNLRVLVSWRIWTIK